MQKYYWRLRKTFQNDEILKQMHNSPSKYKNKNRQN